MTAADQMITSRKSRSAAVQLAEYYVAASKLRRQAALARARDDEEESAAAMRVSEHRLGCAITRCAYAHIGVLAYRHACTEAREGRILATARTTVAELEADPLLALPEQQVVALLSSSIRAAARAVRGKLVRGTLVWTMPDVSLDDVYIGDLLVKVNLRMLFGNNCVNTLRNCEVCVENLSGNARAGYPHPNVNSDGNVCFGTELAQFSQLLRELDVVGAALYVRNLLATYGAYQPYAPLREWAAAAVDTVSCYGCAATVPVSDSYVVDDEYYCESCVEYCNNCHRIVLADRYSNHYDMCVVCEEESTVACVDCDCLLLYTDAHRGADGNYRCEDCHQQYVTDNPL